MSRARARLSDDLAVELAAEENSTEAGGVATLEQLCVEVPADDGDPGQSCGLVKDFRCVSSPRFFRRVSVAESPWWQVDAHEVDVGVAEAEPLQKPSAAARCRSQNGLEFAVDQNAEATTGPRSGRDQGVLVDLPNSNFPRSFRYPNFL